MKFIQKMLASLFAVLLMVTVVAPNTVFADEEVPTLTLHGGKFTVSDAAGLFADEENPVSYYRVGNSITNIGNSGYTFNADGTYTVRASNNRFFSNGVVSKEVNVDVYNEITATVEGLPEGTEVSVFANGEVIDGVYTTDPATSYEITASDVEGYVYDVYEGNKLLTGALKDNKDHNVTIKYIDLNTIGTVVVNNTEGGSVKASATGRVNAGQTVTLSATAKDNYRLASLTVNGADATDSFIVEGGKEYVVEAVFEEVAAVLNDMEVNYFTIKDGVNANNKAEVETAILAGLEVDEALATALADGTVTATITYNSGLITYSAVDYRPVTGLAHRFGSTDGEIKVGNTESVRVVLRGYVGDVKINRTLEATATVSDMRPATSIKANGTVTITYGDTDLKEKVLNVIDVVDENGVSIGDVVAEEISLDNEELNATLLLPTEVTVTFNGRGAEYGISQGTVRVRVNQASTEFDVKSQKNVPYDDYTHELEVRTTPVNDKGVGYVTVYGGIDGDARGFGSIIISPALRNNLKVDLRQFVDLDDWVLDMIAAGGSGLQNIIVPLLPAEIKEFAYAIDFSDLTIDVFKVIETMFQDGIKLDAMSDTLNSIAGLIKTVTGIAGAGSENGADISKVVDTIMDALIQVSDTVKIPMTVYLNQAPKNVGAYAVTGVVADLNYQFKMDVASLIIVPNTDAALTWNNRFDEREGGNVFSYNEFVNNFGGFDFGATLNDGAGKPFESDGDKEHVQILYAGLDTEFNPVLDLNSLEDVINAGPGIYTETAVTVGGNYLAAPITRTFIIEREEVTIENESVTKTYNGKTQSIGDVVVSCEGECEEDLAAKAIVIYTRNGFPVTNPIYAGEYSVLITVPGDANHKTAQKRVTLTIEKDVVTIGSELGTQTTTYDKEAHNYEYTVTCDNPAGEDATVCPEVARRVNVTYYNEEGTALKGAPVNAGTYRVVVEYPGDWNHEAAEYEGTLVINKKQVYVPQVPNVSVRYDGKEHGFIFDCTEEELALIEEAVQITYRNTNGRRVSTPVNVGRYFGDTALKDPANYEYAEGSADRSIVVDIYRANPEVVITVSDAVYDGQPHGATEVVVVDDCENETLPTVVRYRGVLGTSYNSSKAPVNAGNYVVIAGYAGDRNHNADSSMKAFTIEKADVIIAPKEVEDIYYDGEEHAAEYEVCCSNNTETPTPACDDVMDDVYVMYTDPNTGNSYTGESELPVNAGEYAAEVRYPGDRNHNPAKAETKVIIKKAEVKVTLNDASAVYGETPVLTKNVTVENGKFDTTKLNITPVISDPENAYPNVGEYDITANYTPNANVVVTVETATLTVTPKTVTVVIDNQTKKTGKADPEFTWSLSEDSEMAFEEDPSELGVELSREDVSEKAGTYEISGTWTNGNYNVVFVNGTLTIRKPAAPNVNYVVPNTASK